MRRLLPLALLLSGAARPAARAQTTHVALPLVVVPAAQGEIALRNGDYVLLGLGLVRPTDRYQPGDGLAAAAYEHFWTPHWSWGGRVLTTWSSGAAYSNLVVPEVLVRHRAAVGPVTFGQRLSVERFVYVRGGTTTPDQTWGRLRLDVEKIIPLGGADAATGLALRPRLAVEAATHLRLQKGDADMAERLVQLTSARAEVGVRTSARFDFTPWFAYGVNYLVTLPQYDAKGVQTAGGNFNVRQPAVGLDVRFTLGPGTGAAGRQQLPTQH